MTLNYGAIILTHGLGDWHYALGRLSARFETADFAQGLEFVNRIGALAEEQNHHPDLDLQYRRVLIRLTSHDAGGVTDRDVRLARDISAAAAEMGIAATLPEIAVEIGIDTVDAAAIAPFWAAVLGYERVGDVDLVDPIGVRPAVWFQHMDPPRTERNRIHLDVWVPPEVAMARIQAAVAAGGLLLSDEQAPRFWVLADMEGNEVCICTAESRGH